MNLSLFNKEETAKTDPNCAETRARNLDFLEASNVLELCVGPSLQTLQQAYAKFGIRCAGNDIDRRWRDNYPHGRWIMGDCLQVPYLGFDTIVFAPPLSKGCSGKREDALMIDQVNPGYKEFLKHACMFPKVLVLVLPARCMATRQDRTQLYKLMNYAYSLKHLRNHFILPLKAGKRQITKYYDLYLDFR